jgi:hypothetical protein
LANIKEIERKSSAITLSDMEMFIFPELLYSLVLANIMSPRIWLWQNDPWFAGFERMKPYRRIQRLKQYIMDHYVFNLDLDTWGLTTKEKELDRFKDFINEETLTQSNALFGYEGDKYYFDMEIRTHFGLDKYDGDVIPYWKTETVEAMDAFQFKPNYTAGAGECVSLAALYAAALFIVGRIPLKDIYLMATPLHSQNFIDLEDGILTNNRRLVTKNMWYNGTALSAQARRALENERVTIVGHETGIIHTIYHDATIDPNVYEHFSNHLRSYLKAEIDSSIFSNFLRHDRDFQKCFQIKWPLRNVDRYIGIERVFAYEHGSPYRINDNTREKLMAEIAEEEFQPTPIPGRIELNKLADFVVQHRMDSMESEEFERFKKLIPPDCEDSKIYLASLISFAYTHPRLPNPDDKTFISSQEPLGIQLDMNREEIIERLEDIREVNAMADLAFYAYRDLNRIDPKPFILATMERNPVSIEDCRTLEIEEVVVQINEMPDDSIYDEPGRLAQPDEIWNFKRGDGIEKALLLANILRQRVPDGKIIIEISDDGTILKQGKETHEFSTNKGLREQIWEM